MAKKKGFGVKGLAARVVLSAGIVAIGLGLAGCGKQMARIEENQLKLQAMVAANTEQIADLGAWIEQSQQELQAAIKAVQNETRNVAADVGVVGDEQVKLHEAVQNNSQQTAYKVAVIEQNQQDLHAAIEAAQEQSRNVAIGVAAIGDEQVKLHEAVQNSSQQTTNRFAVIEQNQQALQAGIADVQSETRNVAADITAIADEQVKLHQTVQNNSRQMTDTLAVIEQNQQALQAGLADVQSETRNVAADITAIADEQVKLHQTVQNNSWQMTDTLAVTQQQQQERQITTDAMQEDIQQVAAGIGALGQDVLKLQEILQSSVRELISIVDTTGKGQLKFQQSIQQDLRALDDSLSDIKQSQTELQQQIAEVQDNTEIMSDDVPAALEQLKEELSFDGLGGPADMVEMESPPYSPPAETNSVE